MSTLQALEAQERKYAAQYLKKVREIDEVWAIEMAEFAARFATTWTERCEQFDAELARILSLLDAGESVFSP